MDKPKVNPKVKICIIHYNADEAIMGLIKSINKFVSNCTIYIFDNSDKRPLKYRQNNMVYFDNTKGQIINFDKWLSGFKLNQLALENNGCGSAKHCYSVEKCMELINDNFILLDDDVLLKRDISNIYDDKYIYVGQHVDNKTGCTIVPLRVAPFICFINVNMCKQYGIHYFDKNYMHGLMTTQYSDKYDTGAYFLISCKKYQHKDIVLDDYIVHYKGGSWNDKCKSNKITINDWLNKYKAYWEVMVKERIILTMTSWKKRISNVTHIIDLMMIQTMKPDIININLSIEEFPNKEQDLPKELVSKISSCPWVEINWLTGPNRKQWKKIIPTFIKYPNDVIICCDDDIEYPKTFIEFLYNEHLKHPNNPISAHSGYMVRGMYQHCGAGTLEKLEYYGHEIIDLYNNDENIFKYASSDSFYTYMTNRHGHPILLCPKMDVLKFKEYKSNDALSTQPNGTSSINAQEDMMKYLDSVFKKKVKPKVKICIVHYNADEAIMGLIKSINKFVPNCTIYVFDNSDKRPLKYRQNNMVYFDNTKGQIINFDEWLNQFSLYLPLKNRSNYGSAKHCYSVEKCMELINDNFILLDDDVLLKRDISDIYDDKYIYVGQHVDNNAKSKIAPWRVAPFMCFINVNMCKQYGIHYFDKNYMHGLLTSKNSNEYDTGAGFLLHCKQYSHREILLDDYIVHYKGGSWNDIGKKDKTTITDWLNKYNAYWEPKKIISICIVHFNTPLLTECLVKSINHFTPNNKIYIFDNSDKQPFTYRASNIVYMDNTKGQIINFDEWLKKYPQHESICYSAKHCYTIQKCIDMINSPFILMDSDILLKRDISNLFDTTKAYIGEPSYCPFQKSWRILPYICFINPRILKEKKITYFSDKIMGLQKLPEGQKFNYDTGFTLYNARTILPHIDIKLEDYVVHYAGGSYAPEVFNKIKTHNKETIVSKEDWLNKYKSLWCFDESTPILNIPPQQTPQASAPVKSWLPPATKINSATINLPKEATPHIPKPVPSDMAVLKVPPIPTKPAETKEVSVQRQTTPAPATISSQSKLPVSKTDKPQSAVQAKKIHYAPVNTNIPQRLSVKVSSPQTVPNEYTVYPNVRIENSIKTGQPKTMAHGTNNPIHLSSKTVNPNPRPPVRPSAPTTPRQRIAMMAASKKNVVLASKAAAAPVVTQVVGTPVATTMTSSVTPSPTLLKNANVLILTYKDNPSVTIPTFDKAANTDYICITKTPMNTGQWVNVVTGGDIINVAKSYTGYNIVILVSPNITSKISSSISIIYDTIYKNGIYMYRMKDNKVALPNNIIINNRANTKKEGVVLLAQLRAQHIL